MGRVGTSTEESDLELVSEFDCALESFALTSKGDSFRVVVIVPLGERDGVFKLTDVVKKLIRVRVTRRKSKRHLEPVDDEFEDDPFDGVPD